MTAAIDSTEADEAALATPIVVGSLLTDAEEEAIRAAVELGHDVDVVLDWALDTRASTGLLQLVLAGKARVTVVNGRPAFVFTDGGVEAAEELLAKGGGLVLTVDGGSP